MATAASQTVIDFPSGGVAGTKRNLLQEIGSVLQEAAALASRISQAKSPTEIASIVKSLEALASSEVASASPEIGLLIASYVQTAKTAESTVESVAAADVTMASNAVVTTYALNRETEVLASRMEDLGIWNEKELERLKSIDPKKEYKVIRFDENGKPKEQEDTITGAQLRNSATIVKGFANQDKMDAQTKKEFNKQVYGNETGPKTRQDYVKGGEVVKNAYHDLAGDKAKLAGSPEAVAQIGAEVKATDAAIDRNTILHAKVVEDPTPLNQSLANNDDIGLNDMLNKGTASWAVAGKNNSKEQNQGVTQQAGTTIPPAPARSGFGR